MKTLRAHFARLSMVALLALALSTLAGCGGGGGGADAAPAPAPVPQGLRFSIDPTYDRMVQSVDVSGPEGTRKYTLRLSRGQEMLIALPAGDYTLRFWIRVSDTFAVGDFTPRYASVLRGRVTVVHYP